MTQTCLGTVYLVGAGPGDPGLITVRGLELLRRADVIVYDYLANPILLAEAPAGCEAIYVGKRGRGERIAQEKINAIVAEKVQTGKCVVRLKGGDPFIFGRGGEEALFLAERGIPFEIVPGVSAGIAVPAYAGIPLSHRACAADITFVAGHEAAGIAESKIGWRHLAGRTGTIVVFMGMAKIDEIAQTLLEGGMQADVPAAVIRWGTRPEQKTVVATVGTIAGAVSRANIKPPALLVIGEVVSLRDKLAWFEKKPLFGKRVVVTRSHRQNPAPIRTLREYGAEVISFPTLEIREPESFTALDQSIENRVSYTWLVLTSANTVEGLFARLGHLHLDARALGHLRIAAVGEATQTALKGQGIVADCVPRTSGHGPREGEAPAEFTSAGGGDASPNNDYSQEGLLQALQKEGVAGTRVWLPAAAKIRSVLPEGLARLGCEVDVVPVYRTVCPERPACALEAVDWVMFTSASTAKNFVHLLGPEKVKALLAAGMRVACIGPITCAAAQGLGLPCHIMPELASVEHLVEAIVNEEKGNGG